jgi:hypothetical protein
VKVALSRVTEEIESGSVVIVTACTVILVESKEYRGSWSCGPCLSKYFLSARICFVSEFVTSSE